MASKLIKAIIFFQTLSGAISIDEPQCSEPDFRSSDSNVLMQAAMTVRKHHAETQHMEEVPAEAQRVAENPREAEDYIGDQECRSKGCYSEGASPCLWCGGSDLYCCTLEKYYPLGNKCRNVKWLTGTKQNGYYCAKVRVIPPEKDCKLYLPPGPGSSKYMKGGYCEVDLATGKKVEYSWGGYRAGIYRQQKAVRSPKGYYDVKYPITPKFEGGCNWPCDKSSDCADPHLFCCPKMKRCFDKCTSTGFGPTCTKINNGDFPVPLGSLCQDQKAELCHPKIALPAKNRKEAAARRLQKPTCTIECVFGTKPDRYIAYGIKAAPNWGVIWGVVDHTVAFNPATTLRKLHEDVQVMRNKRAVCKILCTRDCVKNMSKYGIDAVAEDPAAGKPYLRNPKATTLEDLEKKQQEVKDRNRKIAWDANAPGRAKRQKKVQSLVQCIHDCTPIRNFEKQFPNQKQSNALKVCVAYCKALKKPPGAAPAPPPSRRQTKKAVENGGNNKMAVLKKCSYLCASTCKQGYRGTCFYNCRSLCSGPKGFR